jgi:hypothetical protein
MTTPSGVWKTLRWANCVAYFQIFENFWTRLWQNFLVKKQSNQPDLTKRLTNFIFWVKLKSKNKTWCAALARVATSLGNPFWINFCAEWLQNPPLTILILNIPYLSLLHQIARRELWRKKEHFGVNRKKYIYLGVKTIIDTFNSELKFSVCVLQRLWRDRNRVNSLLYRMTTYLILLS